jgi:hypothetical protein
MANADHVSALGLDERWDELLIIRFHVASFCPGLTSRLTSSLHSPVLMSGANVSSTHYRYISLYEFIYASSRCTFAATASAAAAATAAATAPGRARSLRICPAPIRLSHPAGQGHVHGPALSSREGLASHNPFS